MQIAEGIERDAQAARLLELGCTLGQGYLFSPAVPIDVAVALLAAPATTARMRSVA